MFASVVTGALAAATLWRMTRRAPAPPKQRKAFAALPDASPAGLSLDPWLEDAQPELDLEASSLSRPRRSVSTFSEPERMGWPRAAQWRRAMIAVRRRWLDERSQRNGYAPFDLRMAPRLRQIKRPASNGA